MRKSYTWGTHDENESKCVADRGYRTEAEKYAWEHHKNVSQAITDWIWSEKVKNDQVRGQMTIGNGTGRC